MLLCITDIFEVNILKLKEMPKRRKNVCPTKEVLTHWKFDENRQLRGEFLEI